MARKCNWLMTLFIMLPLALLNLLVTGAVLLALE